MWEDAALIMLEHPEALARVREVPIGLIPLRLDGRLVLALKASKQSLLAIRQNRGFSVYVMPICTPGGGTVISLVSAFFDDADEPLTVRTPLFGDEEPSVEIVGILMAERVDIYFFDEHSKEWMSHSCRLEDPGSFLASGEPVHLLQYSPSNSVQLLEALRDWFSHRTPEDDARAIRVHLEDEIWPSDIAIMDAREGVDAYHGSTGVSLDMLDRDDVQPGYFQERDIVAAFKRFLDADQLILNPMRRGSDEEFVDVVAATAEVVILVQAKDSPNNAKSMARSLSRKLKTSEGQFAKALMQTGGSLKYAKAADPVPLSLTVRGADLDLHIAGRRILNVIVIREVFPAQAAAIIAAIAEFAARGESLVVLDYQGLCSFIHHFPDERRLVAELEAFTRLMVGSGDWADPHQFLLGRFLRSGQG